MQNFFVDYKLADCSWLSKVINNRIVYINYSCYYVDLLPYLLNKMFQNLQK